MGFTFSQRLCLTALLVLVSIGIVDACMVLNDVSISFYGYPDNDPPGPKTAYHCGGRNAIAGGKGRRLA